MVFYGRDVCNSKRDRHPPETLPVSLLYTLDCPSLAEVRRVLPVWSRYGSGLDDLRCNDFSLDRIIGTNSGTKRTISTEVWDCKWRQKDRPWYIVLFLLLSP